MPGASEQTRPVKVLNANWVAGPDGGDGQFEVMIVTDDDHQHTVAPSPAAMTALLAFAQADTILLWDPTTERSSPPISSEPGWKRPRMECAEPVGAAPRPDHSYLVGVGRQVRLPLSEVSMRRPRSPLLMTSRRRPSHVLNVVEQRGESSEGTDQYRVVLGGSGVGHPRAGTAERLSGGAPVWAWSLTRRGRTVRELMRSGQGARVSWAWW